MATVIFGPQMSNRIQHSTANCYNKQKRNGNHCHTWATNGPSDTTHNSQVLQYTVKNGNYCGTWVTNGQSGTTQNSQLLQYIVKSTYDKKVLLYVIAHLWPYLL